jgi:hypothetical protein
MRRKLSLKSPSFQQSKLVKKNILSAISFILTAGILLGYAPFEAVDVRGHCDYNDLEDVFWRLVPTVSRSGRLISDL